PHHRSDIHDGQHRHLRPRDRRAESADDAAQVLSQRTGTLPHRLKHQAPITKHQTSTNFQGINDQNARALEFGTFHHSCFGFVWCLELGIWNLDRCLSTFTTTSFSQAGKKKASSPATSTASSSASWRPASRIISA